MAPAIIPTATSTPSVRGEGRPHRVSQPFFLERYWQAHRTSLEAHNPVWRFVWPSQHSRGPLSKIIELKINKWQVRGPEDNCQQLWVGDKHRRQIWKGGRLDTAHWEGRQQEQIWLEQKKRYGGWRHRPGAISRLSSLRITGHQLSRARSQQVAPPVLSSSWLVELRTLKLWRVCDLRDLCGLCGLRDLHSVMPQHGI